MSLTEQLARREGLDYYSVYVWKSPCVQELKLERATKHPDEKIHSVQVVMLDQTP